MKLLISISPPKTNMASWKKKHFEDVCPIENGGLSNVMLVYRV